MSKRENDSVPSRIEGSAKMQLAVLISGGGTNLQALIDACAAPDYPARIALVIANKEDAGGLERARQAGIRIQTIRHKDFTERADFDHALSAALEKADVDLICLAGFMRVLGAPFVTRWEDKLINIHPALLPAFKGLHTHARALKAGVRIVGCTVHYVGIDVDVGPIIAQAAVAVLPGDTEESLAQRVLKQEHRLYPLAVELIARGQVTVSDGRVEIAGSDSSSEEAVLSNPLPSSLK